MALQSVWSGTLSFSLVAIPVRLVTALRPGRISFRLLHDKDYSPLVRKMLCPAEDTVIPREEIVRGFETAPGKHVQITDEELASVTPERSRTIEISEFIDLREVDPIYYDHPYYLVPLKGGEKAYRLLAEVMRRANRAGLAKFVLADREHLVAVFCREGALALATLHYTDEILPDKDFKQKEAPVAAEVKDRIAAAVGRMMTDFEPDKYGDVRRKQLVELMAEAARKRTLVEAPSVRDEDTEGEFPVDLVAALEENMRSIKENR